MSSSEHEISEIWNLPSQGGKGELLVFCQSTNPKKIPESLKSNNWKGFSSCERHSFDLKSFPYVGFMVHRRSYKFQLEQIFSSENIEFSKTLNFLSMVWNEHFLRINYVEKETSVCAENFEYSKDHMRLTYGKKFWWKFHHSYLEF